MVKAVKGVLIECDSTIKEIIKNRDRVEKFVIEDLDETHLFIEASWVERIEEEINKLLEENTYSGPATKNADGYYVCRYGHQLLDWQEEQSEETGHVSSRLKRKKIRTIENNTQNERLYGVEHDSLFYHIVQYGLRTMSSAFVHDLGFPPEFEYIVRELWLIFISDSRFELSDVHGMDVPSRQFDRQPDITDLEDDIPASAPSQLMMTKPSVNWPRPHYSHTIVLCYLGCVWLRWPVMLRDIHRWCTTFKLPYLDVIKQLPDDVRSRLDKRSLRHMLNVPSIADLQSELHEYLKAFDARCGIKFPDINAPLLMYRCCAQFFLPAEMYFCAMRLYDTCIKNYIPPMLTASSPEPQVDMPDLKDREAHLMICVIIVTKLCYGLDDVQADTLIDQLPDQRLLSKPMWLAKVKANFDHWNKVYKESSIQSPDVDLALLVDYLYRCVPSDGPVLSGKRKDNVLRSYLARLTREVSINAAPHDEGNLYMQPPDDLEMEDGPEQYSEQVRRFGEIYTSHMIRGRTLEKIRYYHEYELVLTFAARILMMDVNTVHNMLIYFEGVLLNTLER